VSTKLTTARILRDSVLELLLTSCLLFGVVSIVRWAIGPSPISRSVPQIQSELLIVGVAVAILITGLILSPAGKITGGHMNPAISLAMWRFGLFPGAEVAPYVVAQLLGSVVGAAVARLVWGPVVTALPTACAVLQPGGGWSSLTLFFAEAASMAAIVLLVGACLGTSRVAPFVPYIVGGAIALAIVLLGTSTGGSVNPARQFGPALISGQTRFLWVYLLAPMVGAMLATSVWRRLRRISWENVSVSPDSKSRRIRLGRFRRRQRPYRLNQAQRESADQDALKSQPGRLEGLRRAVALDQCHQQGERELRSRVANALCAVLHPSRDPNTRCQSNNPERKRIFDHGEGCQSKGPT
jgi:glycerol uptake facilitator-like aquaporin